MRCRVIGTWWALCDTDLTQMGTAVEPSTTILVSTRHSGTHYNNYRVGRLHREWPLDSSKIFFDSPLQEDVWVSASYQLRGSTDVGWCRYKITWCRGRKRFIWILEADALKNQKSLFLFFWWHLQRLVRVMSVLPRASHWHHGSSLGFDLANVTVGNCSVSIKNFSSLKRIEDYTCWSNSIFESAQLDDFYFIWSNRPLAHRPHPVADLIDPDFPGILLVSCYIYCSTCAIHAPLITDLILCSMMTRAIRESEQPFDAAYIEKFPGNVGLQPVAADSDVAVVQRRLKQRHVQMYVPLLTLTSSYSPSLSIPGSL